MSSVATPRPRVTLSTTTSSIRARTPVGNPERDQRQHPHYRAVWLLGVSYRVLAGHNTVLVEGIVSGDEQGRARRADDIFDFPAAGGAGGTRQLG